MNPEEPPFTRRRMMCDATASWPWAASAGFPPGCPLSNRAGRPPLPSSSRLQRVRPAAGCRLPQVWQIDPDRCIACGRCQTNCVLDLSAVKAVNCFALCGYCDNCTGYFPTKDYVLDTGAENQLCPTGAITRKYIEKQGGVPYFEYTIDERLCIACGKCVVGCRLMNGSLFLQVRHDRCLNCNECSIAVGCPAEAFRRVPAACRGCSVARPRRRKRPLDAVNTVRPKGSRPERVRHEEQFMERARGGTTGVSPCDTAIGCARSVARRFAAGSWPPISFLRLNSAPIRSRT